MKRVVRVIYLFVLFMLFSGNTHALEQAGYPYFINKYDIDIKITENNKAHVKEKLNVAFGSEYKGIIKYLPYKGVIYRENGTKDDYSFKVESFKSNYPVNITLNDKDYVIKIGGDTPKQGYYDIELEYVVNFKGNGNHEFNYNLIETRWSSYIDNISFRVEYPKSIDKDKVFITTGNMYSTDTSKVEYKVNNNVIEGRVNGKLMSYEGLILRTDLKRGYFINSNDYEKYNFIFVILLVVNAIIVWIIWSINGRDYNKVVTSEFKKIDNYNPLELAFIESECTNVNERMVFSLILYLANKGYIKIERKFNNIKIKKEKDYDGNNEIERLLMKRLFLYSKEVVLQRDYKLFKEVVKKIKKTMCSKENKLLIMDKQSVFIRIVPIILGILNIIITAYLVLYGRDIELILVTILLTSIGFALLSYATTISVGKKQAWLICAALVLIFISGFNTTFSIISNNINLLVYYFIGVATYAIIMLFIYIMPRRSIEGNILYSRSLNLKKFLSNPNEEILHRLVKENKNYLYEIISYAYAFDAEHNFMDVYTKINKKIKEPSWYKDETE